jgi:endonuclease/exonuclease/phosphatase family metal-dependent hydrolase
MPRSPKVFTIHKPHRPTPFQASNYPGAGCRRICTTARFLSQTSSKPLTVLNTHLDHVSDEQRRYSASLLLVRGRYEAATSEGPVLLTGDFNSAPTGSDSGAYRIVTGEVPPVQVDGKFTKTYSPGGRQLPDFKFLDTRAETPRFNVSANFATFTDWSPNVTKNWARIDFVLGGSNRRWCVHLSDRSRTWERGRVSFIWHFPD